MIRTTILLALFVLIPLVVCSSQDQDSESSKVTTENRPTDKKVNSIGYGAEECLSATDLVGEDAAVLCNGATSHYPARCYYTTNLVGMDAAVLCNRATSDMPADCSKATNLVGMDAARACTSKNLDWIDAVIKLAR